MSRRYYVSPIIQDPRRGWMADLIVGYSGISASIRVEMPDDPTAPGAVALCVVESGNQSAALGRGGVDAFPDAGLDTRLSALSPQARTDVMALAARLGVDTSGFGDVLPLRDVLRAMGQKFRADFNEDTFDPERAIPA